MLRKTLLEWRRTHRVLVAMALYLLVGMASPVLARLIPEILGRIPEDQLGGVELLITRQPGIAEAMAQYHKNYTMMALAALLLSLGCVASEKVRGIAAMTLSKPVSRSAWVLSCLVVPAGVHALGTLLAAVAAWFYVRLLFGEMDLLVYAELNALLLLYVLCWVVVAVLSSVLARSTGQAAAISLAAFASLSLLGALPVVGRYTPSGIASLATSLISAREAPDPWGTVLASVFFLVGGVMLSLRAARDQEIPS
jgi:ABC-2 type transport system permease protein